MGAPLVVRTVASGALGASTPLLGSQGALGASTPLLGSQWSTGGKYSPFGKSGSTGGKYSPFGKSGSTSPWPWEHFFEEIAKLPEISQKCAFNRTKYEPTIS